MKICRNAVDDANNTAGNLNLVRFNTNISKLFINADERHMIQIVQNLVSNAIKYSPLNPEVLVELVLKKSEILLIVEDKGMGIPEADQKYLFEPFFRAGNVGLAEGNGLGLNIVHESVRLHHGKIEVESKTNEGSRFTVTFPLHLLVGLEIK